MTFHGRWRVAFAGLCVAVLSACASTGAETAASDATLAATESEGAGTTTTTTVAVATGYAVGTREETYIDATRATRDNGEYPGSPERRTRTRFYYPAVGEPGGDAVVDAEPARADGPFPVILFSHGVGGSPEGYERLLTDFAEHGYVVAAPAYPLSNGNAPGGATIIDVGEQPGDASFVLDQVLDPELPDGTWRDGFVDAERVAAAGHSLGGITTYGLVYNTCCVDERVLAAVVLSGATVGMPGTWFADIDTPLLHIHGDADTTVDYGFAGPAYEQANAPKYFITILGGGHSSLDPNGKAPGHVAVRDAAIAFLDAYVLGEEGDLADLERAGTIDGLTTLQQVR